MGLVTLVDLMEVEVKSDQDIFSVFSSVPLNKEEILVPETVENAAKNCTHGEIGDDFISFNFSSEASETEDVSMDHHEKVKVKV